jgi:hypothetical protein
MATQANILLVSVCLWTQYLGIEALSSTARSGQKGAAGGETGFAQTTLWQATEKVKARKREVDGGNTEGHSFLQGKGQRTSPVPPASYLDSQ